MLESTRTKQKYLVSWFQRQRQTYRFGILLTMFSYALLLLFSTGANVMSSRMLGVEGRGQLSAVQSWPMLLASFGHLGIPDSLVYYVARNRERADRFLSFAYVVAFISSMLLVLLLWGLLPTLLRAQTAEVIRDSRIYLAYIPVWMVCVTAWSVFQGLQQHLTWNTIRLLPNLSLFLANLVVCIWFKDAATVLLLVQFITLIFAICVLVTMVYSLWVLRPAGGFQLPERKGMLRFGVSSVAANGPRQLNLRLDQGVIATILPATALGLYAVAASWAYMGFAVVIAVGSASIAPIAGAKSDEAQKKLVARALQFTLLMTLLVAVCIYVLSPLGIPLLFGLDFMPAVSIAYVLIVAAAISTVNGVEEDILRGLGKPHVVLIAEVLGLIITVVGLVLFVAEWGVQAAAWISVVAYSTVQVVLTFGIKQSVTVDLTAVVRRIREM